MADLLIFFLSVLGFCFVIGIGALAYMTYSADPFPFDEDDYREWYK